MQVLVDGQEVLHKKLTTHQVLGVCYDEGQTSNTQNDGNHQIKVVINNSVIKTENFSLQDDLYIGVNYDGANISFVYSGERFMYD